MSRRHLKFTPAPWKVHSRGHDGEIRMAVEDADGDVICTLPKRPKRRFDARLIAAAPDLFNALDALLKEPGDQFCIRRARAALAKATQKKGHT
jgi:hypothetical protein